jgi:hypothetical protein
MLTLTLNDQSTVTGAVTPDTEFDCVAPAATGQQGSARYAGGGDGASSGSSSGDQPTPAPTTSSGSDDQAEQSDGGDQEGDHGQQACDSSLPMQGATVREAQLRISADRRLGL